MMFLLCVSSPKYLPSPSLLASMLGTNFLILLISILIDIIMIIVNLCVNNQEMRQKKLRVNNIVKIIDIVGAGTILFVFVICALYMILSAPFLIDE